MSSAITHPCAQRTPADTQLQRARALDAATVAVQKEQAKRRVAFTLKHPSGPKAKEQEAELEKLPAGSPVLVYREKTKKWEGPFPFVNIQDNTVVVQLPSGRKIFRSTVVKPAPQTTTKENWSTMRADDRDAITAEKRDAATGTPPQPDGDVSYAFCGTNDVTGDGNTLPKEQMWTIFNAGEQRIVRPNSGHTFVESRKAELSGLDERGTFEVVKRSTVPHGSRNYGTRWVDLIKIVNGKEVEKTRLVAQNYRDKGATSIPTRSPTVSRMGQRVAIATASLFPEDTSYTRNISQAYIQSESKLERPIYLEAPPEMSLEDDEVLVARKPVPSKLRSTSQTPSSQISGQKKAPSSEVDISAEAGGTPETSQVSVTESYSSLTVGQHRSSELEEERAPVSASTHKKPFGVSNSDTESGDITAFAPSDTRSPACSESSQDSTDSHTKTVPSSPRNSTRPSTESYNTPPLASSYSAEKRAACPSSLPSEQPRGSSSNIFESGKSPFPSLRRPSKLRSTSQNPSSQISGQKKAPSSKVNISAEAPSKMRELNAPSLSGLNLRMLSTLLKLPGVNRPLCRRILKESGFIDFRRRAASSNDGWVRPCVLPIHYPLPPPAKDVQQAQIDSLFHVLGREGSTLDLEKRRVTPTIRDYFVAYSKRATTPWETVHVLLQMIDRSNTPGINLNAVICPEPSEVLRQAEESTRRWSKGAPWSVLDGVPFTVKDCLDVKRFVTGCASNCLSESALKPQETDADAVRALKNAGMIMIGKCNQDELGIGVRGHSVKTGATLNPFHTEYLSGGSSGGCAASVAAGLCPVSLASGSAGSIRIPAACCGVFGLKASFSRISTSGRVLTRRDESEDGVSSLFHVGPITGCAEDLALIYHLLAGFAPQKRMPRQLSYSAPIEGVSNGIESSITGIRVGVCESWLESCEGFSLEVTRRALDRMFTQGAAYVPVEIPDLEDIRVASSILVITELLRDLEAGGDSLGNYGGIGYEAACKLAIGRQFTGEDVNRCNIVRAKAMEYCSKTLFGENGIDIIVTPALGMDTPEVGDKMGSGSMDVKMESKMMRTSFYANLTGIPACVIPICRGGKDRLAFGIQVMSGPWNEGKLLQVCLWAEKEFELGKVMEPMYYFNALRR